MPVVKGAHLLARRRPRLLLKEFVPSSEGLKRKVDTDAEVFAGNLPPAKRKKQILELFAAKVEEVISELKEDDFPIDRRDTFITILERVATLATSSRIPAAGRTNKSETWEPKTVWNIVHLDISGIRSQRRLVDGLGCDGDDTLYINKIIGLQFCGANHYDPLILLRDPTMAWEEFKRLCNNRIPSMMRLSKVFISSKAKDEPLYLLEALLHVPEFCDFIRETHQANPYACEETLGLLDRHFIKLASELNLDFGVSVSQHSKALVEEVGQGVPRSPTGSLKLRSLRSKLHSRGFRFVFNGNLKENHRAKVEAKKHGIPIFTTRKSGPGTRSLKGTSVVAEVKSWEDCVAKRLFIFPSQPSYQALEDDVIQVVTLASNEELQRENIIMKADFGITYLVTPGNFEHSSCLRELLREHSLYLLICVDQRDAILRVRRLGKHAKLEDPLLWDVDTKVCGVPVGRILFGLREKWRNTVLHLVTPFYSVLAAHLQIPQFVECRQAVVQRHCEESEGERKQFCMASVFPWGKPREDHLVTLEAKEIVYAFEQLRQAKCRDQTPRKLALQRVMRSKTRDQKSTIVERDHTLLVFDSEEDSSHHPFARSNMPMIFLFRETISKCDLHLEEFLYAATLVKNILHQSKWPRRVWLIGSVAQLLPVDMNGVEVWRCQDLLKCAKMDAADPLKIEGYRLLCLRKEVDQAPAWHKSSNAEGPEGGEGAHSIEMDLPPIQLSHLPQTQKEEGCELLMECVQTILHFDATQASHRWNVQYQDGSICTINDVFRRLPPGNRTSPEFYKKIWKTALKYEFSLRAWSDLLPTVMSVNIESIDDGTEILKHMSDHRAAAQRKAISPILENPFTVALAIAKRSVTTAAFLKAYDMGDYYERDDAASSGILEQRAKVPQIRSPIESSFFPGNTISNVNINYIMEMYGGRLRDFKGSAVLFAFLTTRLNARSIEFRQNAAVSGTDLC